MESLLVFIEKLLNDSIIMSLLFMNNADTQLKFENYKTGNFTFGTVTCQKEIDSKKIILRNSNVILVGNLEINKEKQICDWIVVKSIERKRYYLVVKLLATYKKELIAIVIFIDKNNVVEEIKIVNKIEVNKNTNLSIIEGTLFKSESDGIMMVSDRIANHEEKLQYDRIQEFLKKNSFTSKFNYLDILYSQKLQFAISVEGKEIIFHISKESFDLYLKEIIKDKNKYRIKMEGSEYGANEFDCTKILQIDKQ